MVQIRDGAPAERPHSCPDADKMPALKGNIIMKRKKFCISLLLSAFLVLGIYAGSNSEKAPSEKCGECHSDSQEYEDWQSSDHAKSLKTLLKAPNASQSCLKCHSADYRLAQPSPWMSREDLPTLETAKDPLSCSACHRHDSGIKNYLVMPADKLCTTCHVLFCGG